MGNTRQTLVAFYLMNGKRVANTGGFSSNEWETRGKYRRLSSNEWETRGELRLPFI